MALMRPCSFIFTTRHIYQVKAGVARRIISDFVGQRDAPITYGLNALALGTNVNLIYRLNGLQAPETRYHYLLTRDDNGDYTRMKLLRTINNPCPQTRRLLAGCSRKPAIWFRGWTLCITMAKVAMPAMAQL